MAQAEGEETSPAPAISPAELPGQLGYYYGYSFGRMLKDSKSTDVDTNRLMQGLADSLADSPPTLSREELEQIYGVIRERQALAQAEKQQQQQQMQQAMEAKAQENLQLGEAFLAGNRERDGVMVTASGLQYEVVQDSDGPTPVASDTVTVKYTGMFTDGQVFDSSGEREVSFGLQQVIPGWTEGLQLMSVGDKFKFYLHQDLAYGAGGVGSIPPNSVLVFDVELLKIN